MANVEIDVREIVDTDISRGMTTEILKIIGNEIRRQKCGL